MSVSHFLLFAPTAALRRNSASLIHLKPEVFFKDSVLRVPCERIQAQNSQETENSCFKSKKKDSARRGLARENAYTPKISSPSLLSLFFILLSSFPSISSIACVKNDLETKVGEKAEEQRQRQPRGC